jgi:hypothetical protein
MNSKGKKTTIVAITSAILGISVFIMWYLGQIEVKEIAVALAGIAYLGQMVGNYFSKDQTATHTTDRQATGGEIPPGTPPGTPPG